MHHHNHLILIIIIIIIIIFGFYACLTFLQENQILAQCSIWRSAIFFFVYSSQVFRTLLQSLVSPFSTLLHNRIQSHRWTNTQWINQSIKHELAVQKEINYNSKDLHWTTRFWAIKEISLLFTTVWLLHQTISVACSVLRSPSKSSMLWAGSTSTDVNDSPVTWHVDSSRFMTERVGETSNA
jgi:hypothetical protein